MKYLSVCAGIDAASVASEDLGWEAVGFYEIEPFPSAVLAHHYPHVRNYGDMTRHHEHTDIPRFDALLGGTPCQGFSLAGLRGGLDDPRSQLAITFVDIAAKHRPRWLVFENVPGILSSANGEDFATLLAAVTGREVSVPDGGWQNSGHVEGIPEAYGIAWRVLDAQFVRVESHPGAVPQRRRRLFLVGYLGDWRRAAAVLLEPESMRGDPPPRREAGQGVAGTLTRSALDGSSPCGGDGRDSLLLATGAGMEGLSGSIRGQRLERRAVADVAPTLNAAFGKKLGLENQHIDGGCGLFVASTLTGDPYADRASEENNLVPVLAFDCKASGQNGFGIGEVAPTLRAMGHKDTHQNAGGQIAICFDTTQITSAGNRSNPQPGDPCHTLGSEAHPPAIAFAIQAGALRENPESGPDGVGVQEGIAYTIEARTEVQAIAFNLRGREGGAMPEVDPDNIASLRAASGGSSRSYIATEWAVRRLTPLECGRLQGFKDHYTRIPWRGKPAELCPDGPQYKALGNSWATNCPRWIFERMEMVERLAA